MGHFIFWQYIHRLICDIEICVFTNCVLFVCLQIMGSKMLENLQEELLKRLDAYGESVMDSKDYDERIKRAKIAKKRKVVQDDEDNVIGNPNVKKKRRKKKRVTETGNLPNGIHEEEEGAQFKLSGKEKRKQELKDELGLNVMEKSVIENNNGMDSRNTTSKDSKVVVYERPKSKKREEKKMDFIDNVGDSSTPLIDLKSARLDVQKFGIKGFSDEKKDAAMESLLVKLGAKPKKNKAYNYKEYQAMVQRQKVEEREKRELDRKLGYKVKRKVVAQKKDRNDVGRVDGQVGKYKHGVQFVTRKDLQPGGKPSKKKRKKKF